MTDTIPRPYTMDEQPTSTGRLFLARAFAHWCVLHHGCDPEEVEAALSEDAGVENPTGPGHADERDGDGASVEPRVRRQVRESARLIGELVAAGRLRTFARPMGGGEHVELKPSAWELDEYRARFAASAVDPMRPFDRDAAPTHWVFVDMEGFNALTAESCGETPVAATATLTAGHSPHATEPTAPPAGTGSGQTPRLLRMPEVKAKTGLSRSTIYNRIRDKQFPAPRNLGGNISAWPEAEVDRWIADRTQ